MLPPTQTHTHTHIHTDLKPHINGSVIPTEGYFYGQHIIYKNKP